MFSETRIFLDEECNSIDAVMGVTVVVSVSGAVAVFECVGR